MTTYHFDDIEIQIDASHQDSPWVDVALSSPDGQESRPTGLISLSPSEARTLGTDLIAGASEADAEENEAVTTGRVEFDTIHTTVPLSLNAETFRSQKLAERAHQLDRLGRRGWSLISSTSGSDSNSMVLIDTFQRPRA